VAGAVAAPIGQAIVDEEAGYAPQIAAERRQRQQKLEDAQIEVKAKELESQLETGRKYGTLTPEQQAQYVDAISQLYSHPRHAGTLMEKLRRAVHPNGAVAGPSPLTTLKNATPEGGTAAADEANAQKLAETKEQAMLDEIDARAKATAQYHKPAGKSPPTPGNQLPPDAMGPDGQLIPPTLRNAGQSFAQWNGAWYPAPKPKPTYKILKGNLVLMDPATGLPQRNLGPTSGVKISTHQEPFLGSDQMMHLLTLTTVTTPRGEQIEVEPESGGTQSSEGGESKPPAPAGGATPRAKRVGGILPRTGAKPVTAPPGGVAGPVIPGSGAWAKTKDQMARTEATQAGKELPILAAAKGSIEEYLQGGQFDGPGDLALQHTFFTATQPSAGFRMTKVQQDILQNSRSWLQGIKAQAYHAATGQWYTDEQRQQIAKAALEAIAQKEKAYQDSIGGAAPAEGGNVIVVSPEDMK
jgi:hypothetical protein